MALDFTKYGATPAPNAGTGGGIDFAKYGTPLADVPSPSAAPPVPSFLSRLLGHPIEDIKKAGQAVNDAITGQGEFAGQGAVRRGFSAAENAAMAIPTVAADVIPGGRAVLDTVSHATGAAIDAVGNSSSYLADAAQKVGLMTPEERAQYDKNNGAFANSSLGHALEAGASISNSSGNIANVILAAHGVADRTQAVLDKASQPTETAHATPTEPTPPPAATPIVDPRHQELITKTADQIRAVEDKYSGTRKANDYAKDGGQESRQRIAASGVLKYTVDDGGMLRTTDPGGAVDQYEAMTVKPAEGVVRKALADEDSKVNLSNVATEMVKQVKDSGLKGADLLSALSSIEREIEGLRLNANEKGYVPTVDLHDAKINTTSNINFATPPEIGTYRKAIARAYKTLVEEHSNFNVAEVNAELGKYYQDIKRLKNLDGKRVEGGKLGKYAAQVGGTIVGGLAGTIFGPFGGMVGGILGGEASKAIKGKSMSQTFNNTAPSVVPESPVLQQAIEQTSNPPAPPAL